MVLRGPTLYKLSYICVPAYRQKSPEGDNSFTSIIYSFSKVRVFAVPIWDDLLPAFSKSQKKLLREKADRFVLLQND
jgi:hypothetical protein